MTNLISILSIIVFLTLFLSNPLLAQDWNEVEIKTEKLTASVYMLTGRGGNIGLCVGNDGVYMIDSQYAPLSEKIKAAIAAISDKAVRFVLNTHWHGDHSGGNENMAKSGAIIIAHENVRKRMSKEQFIKAFSKAVPASPEAAMPVITFSDDFTTYANGEAILLFHVHNAHTDGDAIVYLPKSNVIHMGDTFFNGMFPFIDMSSGGSIDGVIKTANRVLFLCDEETKIIPGHGPLGNKKDLMAYRDMLMTVRDRVKQAIKAGMTYEEIKAANLATDLDDDWKSESRDGNSFVDLIYTDLSREE